MYIHRTLWTNMSRLCAYILLRSIPFHLWWTFEQGILFVLFILWNLYKCIYIYIWNSDTVRVKFGIKQAVSVKHTYVYIQWAMFSHMNMKCGIENVCFWCYCRCFAYYYDFECDAMLYIVFKTVRTKYKCGNSISRTSTRWVVDAGGIEIIPKTK